MKEIKILELFGGIGACTKAFKRLGIPHKVVDYVEIDKYAVASYNAINDTNFEPQDICTWDKDIEVDLIMHGSPCQDFSTCGKNAGGAFHPGVPAAESDRPYIAGGGVWHQPGSDPHGCAGY